MKKVKLKHFIQDVFDTTEIDLETQTVDDLVFNTMEELGEYVAALTVEKGKKAKVLKETSRQEAVDVIICALSLLKASGGSIQDLRTYGVKKLAKWKNRVKNRSESC